MIREYEIYGVTMQQEGDDDEEIIALIKDVESYDSFSVVINDYCLPHSPEHVWGCYKKLQSGDRIKGELVLINCQTMPLRDKCYFKQNRSIIDYIHYSSIQGSSFMGQFRILEKAEKLCFSVKYPYGNYDMRVDGNSMINVNTSEIGLRGEIYLETVGGIIKAH